MTSKIRVAIIDDHPIVRHGLNTQLGAEPCRFEVVLSANSVEDFDARVGPIVPDVVLLDLAFQPGQMSGSAAVKHLAARYPIVVFTQENDRDRLLAARRAGAAVCLDKIADSEQIRSTITAVAAREPVIGPQDASAVLRTPAIDLSESEREALEYIVDGYTNRQIAVALRISPKTLEGTITRINQRLRDVDILAEDPNPKDRLTVIEAYRKGRFTVKPRRIRRRI